MQSIDYLGRAQKIFQRVSSNIFTDQNVADTLHLFCNTYHKYPALFLLD